MNLLNEPWLPVRHQDGRRSWVAPSQLADPDIVAFDADRADFNGALAQFAIGLLQTATLVDDPMAWRRLFDSPPDSATLKQWFAPIAAAFEFNGTGARFMQDFSLRAGEGATCDIGALLIESPGENALKNNSDHFIKRGRIEAMCPHCAATALLTLQINAPAGGVGHRTGLRGGGPLSTLLLCQPQRSLWHDLWLNVRGRSEFLALQGDVTKTALHFTFPWLADIGAIQKRGGETAPVQVHPNHVFWAMPRRIRLEMEGDAVAAGRCDLCGRTAEKLIRQYETRNYGFNYKGAWDHILSPYYETKEGWLPLHPQPGGFGYRHWLPWVMSLSADKKRQRPARVVDYLREHRFRAVKGQLRLWAFGFDMDNMKARCWYESTLPLYGLADCGPEAQKQIETEVSVWLAGAEIAAYFLRGAVKDAWFSADARGDFSAIDASFWNATETAFYRQLKALIEAARDDDEVDPLPAREAWHQHLANTCRDLFDGQFVGAGAIERQNPRRLATAFQQLKRNLDGPKIRQVLALPAREPAKAPKKAKSAAAAPQ